MRDGNTLFHDSDSPYSMITRRVYDSWSSKPPLTPLAQSGQCVDGNPFNTDSTNYMNLVLKSENKEHESVIATSKIDTCIVEIKSESNCESVWEMSRIKF